MQLALRFGPQQPLRFCVLGSGSSGNAVVFESGGSRLLVDCGFSCREIERRLEQVGVEPRGFEAVVLTHEHGDHVRGVRRFCSRHDVPVMATRGTLEASRLEGTDLETVALHPAQRLEVGPFSLEPFAVPHDAREPIGLVVESESGHRVGVVCDLGVASAALWRRLKELDGLILESNHDVEMLRSGPYPWRLKRRVAGRNGHLSNRDAALGLRQVAGPRLSKVVLYHLSEINNRPALAESEAWQELKRVGSNAELHLSRQTEPTPWLEIS